MGKRIGTPATADLQMTVEVEPDRTAVRLVGEIDAATSVRLRAWLGERVDEDHDMVVDLSGVTFVDSSGLGVLVGALRRVQDVGHTLVLRAPTTSLKRVLEVTGLASAFAIEP